MRYPFYFNIDCVPAGSISVCRWFSPGKIRSFRLMSSRRLFFANIPRIAFRKTCGDVEQEGRIRSWWGK
jgi:hypothetical protein